MPLHVTFQGRTVKRRQRVGNLIKLTLYGRERGSPGDQLFIAQQEWDQHGRVRFLERQDMPDVRRCER